MRAYALEKLSQSGEIARVRALHAEYYRGLFERAEIEWEARPTAEWLADYGRQIDNWRVALDWAFSPDGDASSGVALTGAAVPLWMHLSLMEECRGRVERALAAIAANANGDARREMRLHTALATSLMYARGTVSEIEAAKALEIAESLDDAEYQSRSLWALLWSFHNSAAQHRVGSMGRSKFRPRGGGKTGHRGGHWPRTRATKIPYKIGVQNLLASGTIGARSLHFAAVEWPEFGPPSTPFSDGISGSEAGAWFASLGRGWISTVAVSPAESTTPSGT
jgi:hypothetical protein